MDPLMLDDMEAHARQQLKLIKAYRKLKSDKWDDPDDDGTDCAHPAWWRGNDAGCQGATEKILLALNGQDSGSGVIGYGPLELARRHILYLLKALESISETKMMSSAMNGWTLATDIATKAFHGWEFEDSDGVKQWPSGVRPEDDTTKVQQV